jgi:hypothetical protein
VPFIITQQVQPAWHIFMRQSQQDWIISQHLASPLVQVMQTPLGVISHLHRPIVMLQQHTIMPLRTQQQLTMPPASIVQRFCIMLHPIWSGQAQVIFMPPAHFSNFMVQRGIISMFMPAVEAPVVAPMPGIVMPPRSIIIGAIIAPSSGSSWSVAGRQAQHRNAGGMPQAGRKPVLPIRLRLRQLAIRHED